MLEVQRTGGGRDSGHAGGDGRVPERHGVGGGRVEAQCGGVPLVLVPLSHSAEARRCLKMSPHF